MQQRCGIFFMLFRFLKNLTQGTNLAKNNGSTPVALVTATLAVFKVRNCHFDLDEWANLVKKMGQDKGRRRLEPAWDMNQRGWALPGRLAAIFFEFFMGEFFVLWWKKFYLAVGLLKCKSAQIEMLFCNLRVSCN
ncbi:MAG: hypothetical protein HY842_08045 [Bacteroidetes bacterium]|nr:hypothetical protein [Bacteroidota bacterium]